MYRLPLVFALVGLIPLGAYSAEKTYSCEAPAPIQGAITQAGAAGIEPLLEKYPDNFWVQRALIDSKTTGGLLAILRSGAGIPNGPSEDSVIARFRKEYETRPGDPEAAYLYAYSLIHKNTDKSVEILTAVVQKNPDFPAALFTLALLHGYPNWLDQIKMRKYAEEYLALCPNTTEPRLASLASQLDRSDALIAYAKAMRARIAGKEDEVTISSYPSLWNLELKIALPAEQAEAKKRIELDLQFLEGLDKTTFRLASTILMQGYERTGNTEAMARISKDATQLTSISTLNQSTAFLRAQNEWTRTNLPPPATANQEERTAYHKRQIQFLDEWRGKLPQNPTLLSQRFTVLASLPDTTNEVLVQEGGMLLTALRSPGGLVLPSTSAASPFLEVLRIWAKRGLELDLIPSLVQESLASQTRQSSTPSLMQQSDLYGGGAYQALSNENRNWAANTGAWAVLATTHVKKRQFDQARNVLTEWEKALNERRKKAGEIREKQSRNPATANPTAANLLRSMESLIVSGIPGDESRYYDGCAQLAAAEGRNLDALTYYQSSLRLMYGRSPSGSAELDAQNEADALWKKLGGTQAAWTVWLDSIKTIPAPKIAPQRPAANRPIPKFSMQDQGGKTWTLANLKGKTTLINVWATWCGPCRQELPLLQKLYDQIKGRSDIQIITLNIDQDRSLVDPFLKTNKFSFPSLFASSFVSEFAGSIGIPTTWISDATGTIRSETLGFGGNTSEWVSSTLKQMEGIRIAAK